MQKERQMENHFSDSYHSDENVDNPRIPEKRRLSKTGVWKFCEQISMANKFRKLKLEELNHIKTDYSFKFSLFNIFYAEDIDLLFESPKNAIQSFKSVYVDNVEII